MVASKGSLPFQLLFRYVCTVINVGLHVHVGVVLIRIDDTHKCIDAHAIWQWYVI